MPFPVITLNNLLQWDASLFSNIVVPAGVDKSLLVDAITRNYGEMQCVYPDWSVFRFSAENWFAAHLQQLQHLFDDYSATYNPIYNKDGYIEEVRTPDLTRSKNTADNSESSDQKNRNISNEGSTTATDNPGQIMTESGSEITQYKGFNSSAFNDVTKDLPGKVTTASGQNVGNSSSSDVGSEESLNHAENRANRYESENERGTETIKTHEYGNIGVTMASQMLRDDRNFWETFAYYDVIAKLFAVDNLIMIY